MVLLLYLRVLINNTRKCPYLGKGLLIANVEVVSKSKQLLRPLRNWKGKLLKRQNSTPEKINLE